MIWLRRAGFIAVLVLIAMISLSFYVTEQIMRPGFYELRTPEQGLVPKVGLVNPRESFGLAYQGVEFDAVDGKTLRGWFIPTEASNVAIVAVHGGGSDRRSYLSFAPALHQAGYPVLLFDNREHGVSDGDGLGMSLGMRESEDVSSALDFLQAQGFKSFGVIGNSQGATSAILASANDRRIDLVVAQGTGTDLEDMMSANPALQSLPRWLLTIFGMHFYQRQGAEWELIRSVGVWPIDVIHKVSPTPLFIIQGELDKMAPVAQAERNFSAAGGPKQMWIVEGGKHRGLRGFAGDEFDNRIISFLQQYLPLSPGI